MVITKESQFKQLEPCVKIEGSLEFTSFTYSNFSFPNLLYIKDYLIIHKIDNLTSVKQLLPNLAHIQGDVSTEESALIITENKDLEKLDFNKLMRVSFGYIEVQDNPRLCLNDYINWSIIQAQQSLKVKHFFQVQKCEEIFFIF